MQEFRKFDYESVGDGRPALELEGFGGLAESLGGESMFFVDAYADLKLQRLFEDSRMTEYLLKAEILKKHIRPREYLEKTKVLHRDFAEAFRGLIGRANQPPMTDWEGSPSANRSVADPDMEQFSRLLGFETWSDCRHHCGQLEGQHPADRQVLSEAIKEHLDTLMSIKREAACLHCTDALRTLYYEDYRVHDFYRRCQSTTAGISDFLIEFAGSRLKRGEDVAILRDGCRQRYLRPLGDLIGADQMGRCVILLELEMQSQDSHPWVHLLRDLSLSTIDD